MSTVITSVDQLNFKRSELKPMTAPSKVMMVEPTYYDVEYVINPYMKNQIGAVDKIQARNEWEHLRDGYKELGFKVDVLDGREGFPDMVFCANQSLPYISPEGDKHVLMSIMKADQRKGEVPFIEQYYRRKGYAIHHIESETVESFEGMGDALWHFKHGLIWGAYGFRSSLEVYDQISELFDVPVIALELQREEFYHLDTCMCVLNEETVLVYSDAFTAQGMDLISAMFDTVIEATAYEAENLFAVNAVSPDGLNVLIQQGCTDVNQKLRDAGFYVHEYSTYEFLKSGGSVFCMKMMLW
ncbi:dimethylarginine dimethylaminohydrolase family protein [Rhodohalobacter sp. 8-1]|uniref:dimethylarginine dimethylaminohydrolase family protein n=1 Tax=Rhodohalobacter sp. 8-1 TaxID=3131972 RepID=UPI0030EB91C5